MFREVPTVEVKEVLRQRQRGRFLREIARGVGLDRKTVRRYLDVAVAAGFDPRGNGVGDEIVSAVVARLRMDGCRHHARRPLHDLPRDTPPSGAPLGCY